MMSAPHDAYLLRWVLVISTVFGTSRPQSPWASVILSRSCVKCLVLLGDISALSFSLINFPAQPLSVDTTEDDTPRYFPPMGGILAQQDGGPVPPSVHCVRDQVEHGAEIDDVFVFMHAKKIDYVAFLIPDVPVKLPLPPSGFSWVAFIRSSSRRSWLISLCRSRRENSRVSMRLSAAIALPKD